MECVWGQAICLLIDPTRQERALQDDLRDTAMVHLCTSAKWAVKAELPSMVLVAAQQVWNAGVRAMYVKSVLMIHVGGTRCVTWSIDRIVQRHACITWGVEFIRAIFFIFFFYV